MNIRIANASDLPELAVLFRQTVLTNAPQHYTAAQTEMWASFAADADHFCRFILEPTTYMAEADAKILGFAGIEENGHVASAYVRHDSLHQGVGSALMVKVLEHAKHHSLQRLYAEASEFSLGLFKKFGFQLYDTEVVDRQGVHFKRYLVERHLSIDDSIQ
ncbi:MAG: GNAT family N-acetyltransferase [Leptolyngbya sp. SIO1D8]|nr:GNAT family N-acetyltransferase [Leptolyngbya sp. SIO1D8]